MITFASSAAGYLNLWNKAKVLPLYQAQAASWAQRIVNDRSAFAPVETVTGVPWFMIGLMLMRESSLNLSTYLGNGQPLDQVTTLVPVGRGPWATFAAGAVDAINLEGMRGITQWSVQRILYWLERFNGQGYFTTGINSPYLWSWTDQYTAGKYDIDGHYNAGLVDPQPGCAAILKVLQATNTDVANYLISKQETLPVTTTPATPAAAAQDPIPGIIAMLTTVQGFIPIIAPFLGPYAPVATAAIPLIEDVLNTIEQLKSGQNIGQVLASGLETVAEHLKTISTTLPKA